MVYKYPVDIYGKGWNAGIEKPGTPEEIAARIQAGRTYNFSTTALDGMVRLARQISFPTNTEPQLKNAEISEIPHEMTVFVELKEGLLRKRTRRLAVAEIAGSDVHSSVKLVLDHDNKTLKMLEPVFRQVIKVLE
ncbi:MAG: hypothetical protein V1659_04270 [Candidatus Woesearchaeota archaeon]